MWRNVSFVERIELDFSGNIFNHAIVLGDVDNDQVTTRLQIFTRFNQYFLYVSPNLLAASL